MTTSTDRTRRLPKGRPQRPIMNPPARNDGAVQLDLELQVEPPVATAGEVWQRRRLLGRGLDTAVAEQRERRHPGRDRRLERLAEEGAERHVLPRLDVARAPVVDEH